MESRQQLICKKFMNNKTFSFAIRFEFKKFGFRFVKRICFKLC
jgi:hypothetical protein